MTHLPLFEELVASEAAVRADYIYRNKRITFHDAGNPIYYDATNPDRGATREAVAAQLYENFIRTYNYMFKDSYQHEQLVESKVCNTRDLKDEQRAHLQSIFREFAQQYYDVSGKPMIAQEDAAVALKSLYDRVTLEVPLAFSGMALGSLFLELGRGEKWKDITPRGIDFTRGEPSVDIMQRIKDAIFAKDHTPSTSSFISFPESVEKIGGMAFQVQKVEGWRSHLVTSTGHLIDLTDDLRGRIEKQLAEGKPIEELKVDVAPGAFHLWQFQQPLSEGSKKAKEIRQMVRDKLEDMSVAPTVDGLAVKNYEGGHRQVSLVSMDVDLLTGLNTKLPKEASELKNFKAFLAKNGYAEISDLLPKDFNENITRMPDEAEKTKARDMLRSHVALAIADLRTKASGNEALESLIDRAGQRLADTLPHVYEITDKAFLKNDGNEGKEPVTGSAPKMYMSMGGTASGKGGLKILAKKECGDDIVLASLDDARADAERYWLYLATNNHNDDYKSVEEFAKAHRELTTRRALKGHYHLFVDGSGVPYEGRNDKVTREFKENGYNVSVLAAQAPLYLNDPEMRKQLSAQGLKPSDSAGRLGDRLTDELRIVPIEIAAEKHIGFSIATRNAARDTNVDRFLIQDVSGPVGSSYTLSYVMTLGREQMRDVAGLQGAALKEAMISKGLVPEWVKLPEDKGANSPEPSYDAKVIRDNHDGSYRVEFITNLRQYVNMVQKGLLCREAKGPEAWFNNTMRGDIEGHFKAPEGKLLLQSPQGVAVTPWVNYQPLSGRSTPEAQPPLSESSPWVRS